MRCFIVVVLLLGFFQAPQSKAEETVMLPLACGELLPDISPYLEFFEAVALGSVKSDPRFSKRLFRILSLRNKLQNRGLLGRAQNPVDTLIRKTLCFYREQKEPVRPIPFDDAKLVAFLKPASFDLESKVDQAVYDLELERYQRQQYELRLDRNQSSIRRLRSEADRAAESSLKKLTSKAKKKVTRQ